MATIYNNYSKDALLIISNALQGITEEIYYDVRPTAVKEQMNDFMVINANNRWNDRNTFQYTLMTIGLFARARQYNILPIDKTQVLVDKVLAKLPIESGRFKFTEPIVLRICRSDGLGFGYATIQIRCTANTTDKF